MNLNVSHLTEEQISAQLESVRSAILSGTIATTSIEANLRTYHSQSIDSYSRIVGSDQQLWIFHPATRSYYRSRVQLRLDEYVTNLVNSLQRNMCEVYALSDLWQKDPFFIFATLPTNMSKWAEIAVTGKFNRIATKISHLPSDMFQLVELEHHSGLKWRIVIQEKVDDGLNLIRQKANVSIRNGVNSWNDRNFKPGQRLDESLFVGPRFFNFNNSVIRTIEKLNRKQAASYKYKLSRFNQESLTKHQPKAATREIDANERRTKWNVIAVCAQSLDGIVGIDNELLAEMHSRADLKHFQKTTVGGVIIMGSNTWQSLPNNHLPGRVNIVVSSKAVSGEQHTVVKSLEEAIEFSKRTHPEKDIFLIGGPTLWKYAFDNNLIDKAIISCTDEIVMPRVSVDKHDRLVKFDMMSYFKNTEPTTVVQLPHYPGDRARYRAHYFDVKL